VTQTELATVDVGTAVRAVAWRGGRVAVGMAGTSTVLLLRVEESDPELLSA